jgi:hypothetical protein
MLFWVITLYHKKKGIITLTQQNFAIQSCKIMHYH